MIKLCNTTFSNVQHVRRAFDLLSKRDQEKRNLSSYEAQLGNSMQKYLKEHEYNNISGRE